VTLYSKYRGTDFYQHLYQVFKTWLEDVECDMLAWREKRLRQYYEDRYDYRKNLIDWDYSMSVKDWAEIIHSKATKFSNLVPLYGHFI